MSNPWQTDAEYLREENRKLRALQVDNLSRLIREQRLNHYLNVRIESLEAEVSNYERREEQKHQDAQAEHSQIIFNEMLGVLEFPTIRTQA